MRKNSMIGVLLIIQLFIVGCGQKNTAETEVYDEKITNVEYYNIEPSEFEEKITLPMVVLPYREVNLGITNGGSVTNIFVDKGHTVKEGDVLLKTDDTIFKASYEMAEANLEYQENEFARYKKLFEDKSISEAQFDAAKLAFAQARSNYEISKKNYDNTTLKAPFSGIVTTKNVEIGDILAPGTPAFRIIDMSRVRVQTGIPEKYIGDFKNGNKVSISIDAIPGREFVGTINFISPEADTNVRTFLAEIIIDNKNGLIKAGVMGNADILQNIYENSILIPINSLIETQNGRIVFVLKEGDIVEERHVEIIGENELMVQVTGLNPGEKVIAKGQYDIINGERVNVTGEYKLESGEVEL